VPGVPIPGSRLAYVDVSDYGEDDDDEDDDIVYLGRRWAPGPEMEAMGWSDCGLPDGWPR
jgi:hypothetical protein